MSAVASVGWAIASVLNIALWVASRHNLRRTLALLAEHRAADSDDEQDEASA